MPPTRAGQGFPSPSSPPAAVGDSGRCSSTSRRGRLPTAAPIRRNRFQAYDLPRQPAPSSSEMRPRRPKPPLPAGRRWDGIFDPPAYDGGVWKRARQRGRGFPRAGPSKNRASKKAGAAEIPQFHRHRPSGEFRREAPCAPRRSWAVDDAVSTSVVAREARSIPTRLNSKIQTGRLRTVPIGACRPDSRRHPRSSACCDRRGRPRIIDRDAGSGEERQEWACMAHWNIT